MTLTQPEFGDSTHEITVANTSKIKPHEFLGTIVWPTLNNTADNHLPKITLSEHTTGGRNTSEHHPTYKHWVNPEHHRVQPYYQHPHYQHEPHRHLRYYPHHSQVTNPQSSARERMNTGTENRTGEVRAVPIPNFSTTPGSEQGAGLDSLRRQVLYKSVAEFDGQSPSVLGERGLNPRLACARTVSTVLHRAIGLGVVDTVAGLEQEMQKAHAGGGHFERFA